MDDLHHIAAYIADVMIKCGISNKSLLIECIDKQEPIKRRRHKIVERHYEIIHTRARHKQTINKYFFSHTMVTIYENSVQMKMANGIWAPIDLTSDAHIKSIIEDYNNNSNYLL